MIHTYNDETEEKNPWIYVVSPDKKIYMAEKIRGFLNHSSILSGGATLYSGYISLHKGEIDKASPLSGHYLPSDENFIKFLKLL